MKPQTTLVKKILIVLKCIVLSLLTVSVYNVGATPFFYEVTGNAIEPNNPVYLLGSCHSLTLDDYGSEITKKIESTEILISEFPSYVIESTKGKQHLERLEFIYDKFLNQDLYWFQNQFLSIGLSYDKTREKLDLIKKEKNKLENPDFFHIWFNELTEKEKKLIKDISAESDINLLSIHPGILWELITYISDASLDEEHVEDCFEIHLIKQFTNNDKEIIFLDTLTTILWEVAGEEFIENLERSTNDQVIFIQSSLEKWKQSFSWWKDCWSSDDYADALDMQKMISQNITLAVNARNLAWKTQVIQTLSSGKSASIVTGAYHLLGASGFLNLLKSHGYHVKLIDKPQSHSLQQSKSLSNKH